MVLKKNLVKEPKSFLGARRLLFHRLIDEEPNELFESGEESLLDKEGVKESIHIELRRLLNTRVSKANKRDDENEGNVKIGVLGYGLLDFSSFDAANKGDWYLIANSIKSAVDTYEKRLKNISVAIDRFDEQKQTLYALISGELNIKRMEGEVTFDIALECSGEK